MTKLFSRAALLCAAAGAMAVAGAAAAQPAQTERQNRSCFYLRDWDGWRSPSPDLLYIKVRRDVYRVDLLPGGQRLDGGGRFLVNDSHSAQVCGVSDLFLKVADTSGFSTPLFPTRITRLTQAEIDALPRNHRP